MLAAKRELEVDVENLQARMTMVEVAQTTSPVAIDDSHLSSTRRVVDDIRTRIDVAERMVPAKGLSKVPSSSTKKPRQASRRNR